MEGDVFQEKDVVHQAQGFKRLWPACAKKVENLGYPTATWVCQEQF